VQWKAALHIIAGQLSEEKIKVGSFWWGGPAGHFRGRTQVSMYMYGLVTGLVFHSCDQPMEAVPMEHFRGTGINSIGGHRWPMVCIYLFSRLSYYVILLCQI
jgi:hypothetical protein